MSVAPKLQRHYLALQLQPILGALYGTVFYIMYMIISGVTEPVRRIYFLPGRGS
jgi:hypothetical protein